jgi:hypothetical protein
VKTLYGLNVTAIPTLLEKIHDRVLEESRMRCAQYDDYLSTFQRKMDDELDESKRSGE